MAVWTAKMETERAHALREAIDNEDANEVLTALVGACQWICDFLEAKGEEDCGSYRETEDLIDNAQCYIGDEDIDEDDVNELLDEFFDICDGERIWVDVI